MVPLLETSFFDLVFILQETIAETEGINEPRMTSNLAGLNQISVTNNSSKLILFLKLK